MDFRILGPLEVIDEGKGVALRGDKQRALLALLLLHPNEALSADRLIHELWGEYPPATAGKSLQMHVSRVRAALAAGAGNGSHGDGPVLTRQHGYELRVDPECVDSHRFERLVGEGRRELSAGRPERAVWALESALLLWRGSPLADVAYESFAQHEIARLEALRVEAFEELIDAKLALGLHAELVGKLQVLVAEHPYEERLCRQLMLALYRSDRQADALQAYQDARSRLVEELGLEPGERLRELERAILKQDPALAAPASELPSRAPLSSGFGRANGLPSLPNPTIGRAGDVRAVVDRLRVDGVRLLTLTGPGGVGKTRLALEASRAAQGDFADGAHFVSLAALRRPEDLPGAIVNALAIAVLSGESADQAAERFLSAKHLLLVVDNCEHLLAAAPFIGSLLRTCPALTVLATSREPLGLQAEERCPVSPLTLPEPATPTGADALVGVDAVALFCARARAQDRDFDVDDANAPAVAEICRRVDGLPLAIELAAARCGLLSPDEIAERLQGTLGALGPGARDAPARQQTLRATIDWSYALLTEEEKQCFARFAVFARSATVEAAETITHARLDTLDGLVAKSLLVRARHTHTPTRLWMLDTVHAYAAERFVSAADVDTVHEDHCRYYLALAQRHGRERALWGADAPEHLARLDAETNNIQVALGWAVE